MKVLVFGSRTLMEVPNVQSYVFNVLDLCPPIANHNYDLGPIEVVDGKAKGADTLGNMWAHANHHHTQRFTAYWNKYGKAAGFRRNEEMATYLRKSYDGSNALAIGFVDKPLPSSKGTYMMYNLLTNKEPVIPTYVFDVTTRRIVAEPVSHLF